MITSAVAMRRFAWLRSTNLPQDTKTIIEDMAFDELGLFHKDIKTSRPPDPWALVCQGNLSVNRHTSYGPINDHMTGTLDLSCLHPPVPLLKVNPVSNSKDRKS